MGHIVNSSSIIPVSFKH